jgi:uracil-DNA glycosylase
MTPTGQGSSSGARGGSGGSSARIHGTAVPLFAPADGPVYVLILGEAPGPRGADKSGIPFFGDAAGRLLYAVLQRLQAATLDPRVGELEWDGAVLTNAGMRPALSGVALSNAFNVCPTDDGVAFRAPTRSELEGEANLSRLLSEVDALRTRGLTGIVTLGKVATRTIDTLLQRWPRPELARRAMPHPSAQGLLSMAPDRGKGARMADLQEAWMVRCQFTIVQAGYPYAGTSPGTAP